MKNRTQKTSRKTTVPKLAASRQDRRPVVEPLEARIAPAVTVTLAAGLGIDLDGDGVADPGDTLHYTATVSNPSPGSTLTGLSIQDLISDPNLTLVPGSIHISPVAFDDTYTAVGNTLLEAGVTASGSPAVSTTVKLLANDLSINVPAGTDTLSIVSHTNPTHGTLTSFNNADGSFSYVPDLGYTGSDTFTYVVKNSANAALTDTGTVTINIANKVWYVDNSAAAGDGRSSSPFSTLAAFQAVNDGIGATHPVAGDFIYLAQGSGANYTGGVTLLGTQKLIGAGDALVVGGFTLKAAGTTPTVVNAAGNAVTLGSGNTLDGFNVGTTSGLGITGVSIGTLTVDKVAINTTGAALSLSTGTFAGTGFTSITGKSVSLTSLAGTVSLGSGALSTTTGDAFFVSGGAASITYSGTITEGAAGTGHSVDIVNKTAGTVALSGAVNDSGTGLLLNNNTGTTISLTGGVIASTGVNKAFTATGAGTINVTGANNTLTTTSGTALDLANVTSGASGMTFKSISSNGAANGISLVSLGGGSLTVTGDGTGQANGSGGSIANALTEAVHMLTNSGTITFKSMNFVMNTSAIDGILVDNNAGGTVAVNFTGCTFTGVTASVSQNKSLLQYEAGGSANVTANVQNSFFNSSRTYGFFATAAGTATMNVTVNQSGFGTNVNTGAAVNQPGTTITNPPAFGLGVTNSSSSLVDYTITNNTFWGADGSLGAIYAVTISGASTTAGSHLNGSFNFNKIGKTGVTGSGASNGAAGLGLLPGVAGAFQATVIGNDIRQVNSFGVNFTNNVGAGSSSVATLKIKGNTIAEPDTTGAPLLQRAIVVSPGNSGGANTPWIAEIGDTTGTNAANKNTIADGGTAPSGSNTWQPGFYIRVTNNNNAAALTLPGLTPTSGATAAQVNAFVQGANTLPASSVGSALGTAGIIGGAPLPLLFAPSIGDSVTPPVGDVQLQDHAGTTPMVGADAATPPTVRPLVIVDDGMLSQAELDSLVGAAIARWEATGLTPAQDALLHSVSFSVADLPGWYLGEAGAGHVTLDRDAAGNGWFVDATPLDDAEFSGTGTKLGATANGGAATRLDALTTVMHELGHQLGLDDTYANADQPSLMYGYLHQSERRLPGAHQADGAVPHLAAGLDYQFGPLSLGAATLPVNKSLTVVYDQTINAALSNGLAPTVSSQIRFTHAGGNVDSNAVTTTLDSLTLGGQVWIDADGNTVFNSGTDTAANPIALTLLKSDGTTVVTTGSTNGSGVYQFTGLLPGDYIVRVDASNFGAGQPLAGKISITGAVDPDDNIDNDDNGVDNATPATNGIRSLPITLAYNTEPTAGVGNDTNNTLDFGFKTLTADLSITKTDGVTTKVPGTTVTYTIVASNAGPSDATGATVADTFPASLSSVTWTAVGAGGGTVAASGSGNISELVNLPSGGSVTFTVTGLIAATATGSLSNTATVTAPGTVTDPTLGNNSATDTDTLTPQGDLSITKTDGATTEIPGTTVTYTIVVGNTGPSTATGATVADTFAATLSSVTWTAAYAGGATGAANGSGNINQSVTLPSGSSATYTVTGTIASSATGTLSNTATVAAPGGFTDSTPGNNSATDSDTLTPQADLAITKTDGATTEIPGTTVTYTIVASNAGPSDAAGATVADTFPATLSSVTWTVAYAGGASGAANGSGNINQSVTLPSGGSATYTVTGTIASSATGTLANTATITAPGGVTDPTPGNNSATDTDTLNPQGDLTITKTDGVTTEIPGTGVTYTIVASNTGPSNVVGATVADTFPAILTGVTWTAVGAGGGTVAASGSGNINELVNLPSGASVTFTVTGTIAPTATGSLANTATIAAPGGFTDPTPGNNSATDTDTLTPSADLSITKTDGVTTAIPGGTVTYTIVASNAGPSAAPGATVADTFPATLSSVTWTAVGAGGGTVAASGSGNIGELVNLPSGASVTFTVTGTIAANATGSLSNTATIATPGGVTDPTPGNNSATDTDTLNPQADLQITKTDGKTSTGPGANTYTIVVSNVGPSSVTGATVADTFPAGFTGATWTAVVAGGATGTLNGNGNLNQTVSLPSGSSITYTVNGTIPNGTTGTLSNTATVTAPGGVTDPTPGNNSATDTTTVISDDLSITKTDGSTTEIPGTTVTYTIVVSNSLNSTQAANGALVVDNFAATLSGVTWTAVTAGGATGTASGSGNLNQSVNLPINSSITYTVTGTINPAATGTLVNTATVTAPGGFTEADLANNSATDTDTLTPQADLSIAKTDGVTTKVPGTGATYTIVVSNSGPSTATGVSIADTFPAILTGTTYTATASGTATGFTASGSGNLNDTAVVMAPGSSITYVVTGTVNPSATGTLSNTATVSSAVTDPTPGNNSATDTDTLTPQTDVSVTKTDGVTTAVPGGSTTYTIVVSNSGPSTATSTTLSDTFPASISGATWTSVAAGPATGNTVASAGNINETLTLFPGSSVTYTVTATIGAGATGSLANTATVSQVNDTTPGNNNATDTDTLTPQANLAITKTDGVTSVIPGGSVTYTIVASNAGPSNVVGATVADTFPAILTGVTWTAVGAGGGTATAAGSGNINDTVNLPVGGSVTYTVSGTVSPAATGTLANTATITAPGGVTDPTPGNNSATDTDTLTPQADLAITKTDGVTTVIPGASVTYTIVASNPGPSNVVGATVADTFPAILTGVTWTAVGAGGGTATASGSGNINDTVNLPSGASVTYTVSGTVSPSATGTLSNTATVTAPGGVTDPTPGNNSATDTDTLTPNADLAITKTDGVTSVIPGGPVTYTIVVSNSGLSNVIGATVADTFPATLGSVTWTSVGAGGGTGTAAGAGNINDTVNLPAGGSVTYTVTGTVASSATGSLANTATVTAPITVTDPTPGNNSATDTDTLTPQADLVVTKSDAPDPARRGQNVTYTINLSNAGLSDAQTVAINDLLPTGTTFVSATAPGGWAAATPAVGGTGTVTFTKATVASAETGVFTIVVKVDANTPATSFSNTAIVTTATTDPVPANNMATATSAIYSGIYVTAPGIAAGNKFGPPKVRVFDPATGTEIFSFLAYEPTYKDSIRVAVGDINNDGFDDVITTTGKGTGRLRVFLFNPGANTFTMPTVGAFSAEIALFDGKKEKGAFVGSGDLNGDGQDDIVVGSALGGGKVKVINGLTGTPVTFASTTTDFLQPFGTKFKGGVRVAVGDLDGDGKDDLVVGQGFKGAGVKVFAGRADLTMLDTTVLHDFTIKNGTKVFTGGVSVATGDLDGDGKADLIIGRNTGKPTQIETFKGTNLAVLGAPILPFDLDPLKPKYALGVRVAAVDVNGDGIADIIAGAGAKANSQVKIYDGSTHALLRTLTAYPDFLSQSLFVAGSSPVPV